MANKCAMCEDAGTYRRVRLFGRGVGLVLCESHVAQWARIGGTVLCEVAHRERPAGIAAAYRADNGPAGVNLCRECLRDITADGIELANVRKVTTARDDA